MGTRPQLFRVLRQCAAELLDIRPHADLHAGTLGVSEPGRGIRQGYARRTRRGRALGFDSETVNKRIDTVFSQITS